MAIKKSLFAAALLSLALASSCAKGGGGPCVNNCPAVTLSGTSNGIAVSPPSSVTAAGVSIDLTATVTGTSSPNVNWAISGTSCTGSPNPCGSFTSTTGTTATYQVPSTIPSSPQVTITATSQAVSTASATIDLTIEPVTTAVTPVTQNIGQNLTQQFTATATPDNAPQTFTWTCTASGVACANFTPAANNAGAATYVAQENCGANCILVSAVSTANPTGCTGGNCTSGKASIVTSRLNGSKSPQSFSFKFSGYDNNGKQVFVAGTFVAVANPDGTSTVSSGVEDEVAWNGSQYAEAQHSITAGSFAPITASDLNSNNRGVLSLSAGVSPSQFLAVLDAAGNIQIVESDGQGTGSGIVEPLNSGTNFTGAQTFAFGFTGVDYLEKRVGYAGIVPVDGSGNVASGMMDVNDNASSSVAGLCASPCSVSGTYTYNAATNLGQFALTSPGLTFDFFLANGSGNANNPLTLYAISTNTVDAAHPAVLGTLVLQDSKQTYNNAAFNDFSISTLIGANANVSLTLGKTDGSSSGTGGTGGFSGVFDWNNNGTLLTYPDITKGQLDFSYTYVASFAPASAPNGRYIFQYLGNPGANPVVPPMPFVLYASGQNRGFLLDQSSAAVITGTMNPQKSPPKSAGTFSASAMAGTYAVATNTCASSGTNLCNTASLAPLTMNLLLTSPGNAVFNIAGAENPGAQSVAGSYTVDGAGFGQFTLTKPGAANYKFYSDGLTDLFVIEMDNGVPSPILHAAQ